ncbi:DsbA family protein [Candidatus Woesearchaeota archaeon]|nr:DsbA family protein [Candidatus Woesearchaeota archaeon]
MVKNNIAIALIIISLVLSIASVAGIIMLYGKISPEDNSGKTTISEDNDPALGAKNAPVTIVGFTDFQCPYCGRFSQQTLPLIEKDFINTGKARFVLRDFPLSFHANSKIAAEAANCANEQSKFWQYHDKLFENQNALDKENLKKYAREIGIDGGIFDSCLDSGKFSSEVQKDLDDGIAYGVSGTPAFFINGKLIEGAQPYPVFEKAINEALNK